MYRINRLLIILPLGRSQSGGKCRYLVIINHLNLLSEKGGNIKFNF